MVNASVALAIRKSCPWDAWDTVPPQFGRVNCCTRHFILALGLSRVFKDRGRLDVLLEKGDLCPMREGGRDQLF